MLQQNIGRCVTLVPVKIRKELKNFLSEFGFKLLSDWALLNRARVRQLESLSKRDRLQINAFHLIKTSKSCC